MASIGVSGPGLAGMAGFGPASSVWASHGRHGEFCRVEMWTGVAGRVSHGEVWYGSAWQVVAGKVRPVWSRPVKAGLGLVCFRLAGKVWCGTFGYGKPGRGRRVMARFDRARLVLLWQARLGRQG